LVITVELFHAAKIAFALFARSTANPNVVNRLDLIFVEHVGCLHDSRCVNHRVVVTRNIDSQSAASQSVLVIVVALIGFFVVGVFNNLSIFIEVQFIRQSGKFCFSLDQCVSCLLEFDRNIGGRSRQKLCRIDRVNVTF